MQSNKDMKTLCSLSEENLGKTYHPVIAADTKRSLPIWSSLPLSYKFDL